MCPQPELTVRYGAPIAKAGLGRSATFKSERERFDRRRSQYDPTQTAGVLRSSRCDRRKQTVNEMRYRGASAAAFLISVKMDVSEQRKICSAG